MKRIKSHIIGSMLLIVAIFAAAPLYAQAPPEQPTITCDEYYSYVVENSIGGTVTVTPKGSCWTLEAVPNEGWKFLCWNHLPVMSNPVFELSDFDWSESDLTQSFEAVFQRVLYNCTSADEFIIETSAPDNYGTIAPTIEDGVLCMTAAPRDGNYTFVQWADGLYVNPRHVSLSEVTGDTTFNATFIETNKIGKIDFWRKDGIVITTTEDEGELDDIDQFHDITVFYNGLPAFCGHPDNEDDIDIEPRLDLGVYYLPAEYAADHSLAGKSCHIVFRNEIDRPVATLDTIIPYLIDGDDEGSSIVVPNSSTGVHVLDGGVATFTSDQEIADLDIYPGGKAVVDNCHLIVSSLTMRADALTPFNAGSDEWRYPFPHPELLVINDGYISNYSKNDTIYYDYVLDYISDSWYPFALPYASHTSKARYRSGEDASDRYLIDQFSTENRAGGGKGWTPYYDTDSGLDGGAIEQGKGYDIYAVPSDRNEDGTYGAVIRFPMYADLTSGVGNQQIHVSKSGSVKYDMNWNLISIPYLSAYPHGVIKMYNEDLYIGKDVRYVTFPNLLWNRFYHEEVSSTVLYPFHPYFVQFEDDIDNLRLTAPTTLNAPKRRLTKAVQQEINAGITLRQQGRSYDHIGIHIGENYTAGYDVNADLAKMIGKGSDIYLYSISDAKKLAYIALPPTNGTGVLETVIPLGYDSASVGQEMTFDYDDLRYPGLREDENVYALNLIDEKEGVTVNLLEESYTCTALQASDNSRFSLGIVYQAPGQEVPTGCDEIRSTALPDGVYDLLGRPVRSNANALPAGVYIVVREGKAEKEVIR